MQSSNILQWTDVQISQASQSWGCHVFRLKRKHYLYLHHISTLANRGHLAIWHDREGQSDSRKPRGRPRVVLYARVGEFIFHGWIGTAFSVIFCVNVERRRSFFIVINKMERLSESFAAQFTVSSEPNDTAAPHPRYMYVSKLHLSTNS